MHRLHCSAIFVDDCIVWQLLALEQALGLCLAMKDLWADWMHGLDGRAKVAGGKGAHWPCLSGSKAKGKLDWEEKEDLPIILNVVRP